MYRVKFNITYFNELNRESETTDFIEMKKPVNPRAHFDWYVGFTGNGVRIMTATVIDNNNDIVFVKEVKPFMWGHQYFGFTYCERRETDNYVVDIYRNLVRTPGYRIIDSIRNEKHGVKKVRITTPNSRVVEEILRCNNNVF